MGGKQKEKPLLLLPVNRVEKESFRMKLVNQSANVAQMDSTKKVWAKEAVKDVQKMQKRHVMVMGPATVKLVHAHARLELDFCLYLFQMHAMIAIRSNGNIRR